MISIIVPTYREAPNIPLVVRAVEESLAEPQERFEIVFVDDDSGDDSEALCAELAKTKPVRMLVRRGQRGLATAVIHGIDRSSGEIIVVMDGDLSHPPHVIPTMVERLKSGRSDFVLGSRYIEGGSVHEEWTPFRKLNSRVSSMLAKPLCPLKDPMSGFFALRRDDMPDTRELCPVGYKIALEIFVKGAFEKPSEIPIRFDKRRLGESKLSFKEQLNFLRHLGRLYAYKLGFGARS